MRVSGTLKPAFKAGPSFLALAGNVFSASAMSLAPFAEAFAAAGAPAEAAVPAGFTIFGASLTGFPYHASASSLVTKLL